MTYILELGTNGNRFARHESTVPNHVLVFQNGFIGRNGDVAFPSVVAIDRSIVKGDISLIGHARGDVELETIHRCGGIGSQSTESLCILEDGNIRVA